MKLNIETIKGLKTDFTPLKNVIKKHFIENENKRQTQRQDLEIDVHFADKPTMLQLNKAYRGKDYLTDVLSFSYLDGIMEKETLSGEIFISLEKAEEQAKQKNNDIETELNYLITHGYLHIIGYLHETDEQEVEMNTQEDLILELSIGKTISR